MQSKTGVKVNSGKLLLALPASVLAAQLQSALCLAPAWLLHLRLLSNTATYAYGVSASASKIAAN